MDKKTYEILASITDANYEISSLLDILEAYSNDNSVDSKTVFDIYALVVVIKAKHIENMKNLSLIV